MTDIDAAARRLGEALAFPTVSKKLAQGDTRPAFDAYRAMLSDRFPLCHARLTREEIGPEGALLYSCPGADPALPPWLFISHQDVVAAPGPGRWTHGPFSGAVADGFVWGRGALDVKVTAMAMFEALERLFAAGWTPRRGFFLGYGADEETGGELGAALIAETLRARGVRLAFSLDEGGIVTAGAVPGVEAPVGAVGLAEKGYLTVRFVCEGAGGHSSLPSGPGPAERLASLLHHLHDALPAPRLEGPTLEFLWSVSPLAKPPYGRLYRYAETLSPIILRAMRGDAATEALTRTTAAVTMIRAGHAENVTPDRAEAVVNLRPLPGDKVADLLATLESLAARHGGAVAEHAGYDASPVSRVDAPAYGVIRAALADALPDVTAAPMLTPNGTDSRHYEGLADQQYRFMPTRLTARDLERIHGVDERISLESYAEMIGFYESFARRAGALGAAPAAGAVPATEAAAAPRV